ncbi:MAG: efflux RND transporter periplasmic adaptor subunit [Planctomycetota bacterium]
MMADRSQPAFFMKTLLSVAVLAACTLLAVVLYRTRPQPPEAEPLPEKRVAVRGLALEARDLPLEIAGTGTVHPYRRGRLAAEIAGRIVWISPQAEEGGTFAQGEELVRLEATDAAIAEKRARAALESARARLVRAKALAEDKLVQAQLAAEALDLVRAELLRAEELAREGLVSPQEVEYKKIQENTRRSAAEFRARELTAAQAESDASVAEAELAEQDLAAARERLADCVLRAPFAGNVTRRAVEVGDTVAPGQVLLEFVEIEKLRLRVAVPAEDVAWVDPGDAVEVTIRALDERRVRGEVEAIIPDADLKTRTFEVIVRIVNSESPRILPGMFARAVIQAGMLGQVLSLPRGAVCDDTEGPFVWVIDTGTLQARRRPIEILRWLGETAIVRSGLRTGELVAQSRLEQLFEGALVEIAGEPEKGERIEEAAATAGS